MEIVAVKKVGVVFSGFGSQFVGMAKDVYDESRFAQEYFEEAYNCLNINFVKLCFASSDEELSKVDHAYLAIFLTDLILYNLLTEAKIQPTVLAGQDVGMYAALFAAGGFTFPDGLYLLNKYAGFYQAFLEQHKNLRFIKINGCTLHKMRTLCRELSNDQDDQLCISAIINDNCQIVAGQHKMIKKLEQALDKLALANPVQYSPHNAASGVHCELAQDLINNFKIYFTKVDFKDLQIPVLSTINGKLITSGKAVKKELLDQELHPVIWPKIIQGLAECEVVIEVGPGQSLAAQIQQVYPDKIILTLNKKEDMVKIRAQLDLDSQDWTDYEE